MAFESNCQSNNRTTCSRTGCTHLVQKTHQYIQSSKSLNETILITPGQTVIVGLSGGPDSVCLLHVLKQLQSHMQLTLIAAHLDHEWRHNSSIDALFCKQYARSLDIEYIQARASEIKITKKYNGSKEELGRLLRRSFFESVAEKHATSIIALAHHRDDQQETFFLRMIRGASIAGLAGIKPFEISKSGYHFLRPFLEFSKNDLLDHLKENNLPYVHDTTNEDQAFLRNTIRLKVLPALKSSDQRFETTFQKTHAHIVQTNEFITRLTEKTFLNITEALNGELALSIDKFFACDSFLYHGLILTWLCKVDVPFSPSTGFFDEIVRFLKNPGLWHQPNTKWIITKKTGLAIIKKL